MNKGVIEKKNLFTIKLLYENSIKTIETKRIALLKQLEVLETAISDH